MSARSFFLYVIAAIPTAALAQDSRDADTTDLDASDFLDESLTRGPEACEATSTDLMDAVNKATAAFSAMDRDLFQLARDEARRSLTCVNQPLAPASAAAYHRMEAFAAFFEKDEVWGMASFRAALSVQPAYELDASIAPEGCPVDIWYQEAQNAPSPPPSFEVMEPPEACSVLLDGAAEALRQVELPVIAQVLEWDGSVRWTGLLLPSELIPEEAYSDEFEPVWPPRPTVVVPPGRGIDDDTPTFTRRISPLWFGAGGAALATGGLYAASWATRGRWQAQMDDCGAGGCWDDPDAAYNDSELLRKRTNLLAYAAGGAGVLTLGLGVGAVFTVEW